MRLFVSWLVASQSFASLHFALSMISTCASKTFKPVLPHESTISTYMWYSFAILSKFVCAISNFQNKFLFCVLVPLARRWGMTDIVHARCVILTMSVYSLMLSPKMKNEFTLCCQIINSLESVGMGGTRGYG